MYHRVRKKMTKLIISAILLLAHPLTTSPKALETSTTLTLPEDEGFDNNIIDFDEEYTVKFNKKYGAVPWHANDFDKNTLKYTVIKDGDKNNDTRLSYNPNNTRKNNNTNVRYDPYNNKNTSYISDETTTEDFKIIPLELVSTTEDALVSIGERTTEDALVSTGESTTEDTLVSTGESTTEDALVSIGERTTEDALVSTGESTTEDTLVSTGESTTEDALVSIGERTTEDALVSTGESTTEDTLVSTGESTTEDALVSIAESTTEQDLTVIPLSTTKKLPRIEQTVTLPATTDNYVTIDISETTTNIYKIEQTTSIIYSTEELTTTWEPVLIKTNHTIIKMMNATKILNKTLPKLQKIEISNINATELNVTKISIDTTTLKEEKIEITKDNDTANENIDFNTTQITHTTNTEAENRSSPEIESKDEYTDVPVFTELDTDDFEDIPEDYYDSKDVLPTSTPKTDAISVLFGLAGSVVESVVESVAEKVVPKSIYDLFKRMQRQSEAIEAEKLRSREENGGLGQFGRGILKSLSNGLTRPLSQLMAGVKEAGSLDTDRGFVGSVASSVTSVANAANSYLEAFKDKVQAIYPGTVWCGDGRSAQARSSDLGLFFFTDTCCRQHDACKIYIRAGETKFGLTNTGLFTRSHCSCDANFRACLRHTNSLVSAQIGLTYFNVLGPQCFRRAHPIVKCNRRTRITGQKCEEYELDYTKPRMWQWFDNETF